LVLEEEVGQASGAVGGFLVGPSEDLFVGGDMVDCGCIGFDGGSAWKKDCGRELVDVVAVVVGVFWGWGWGRLVRRRMG
jgi:hypothetical protein